jgi:hypothetical protein
LYQWGRAKDGHESRTSGTTEILASSITTPAPNKFILDQSIGVRDWIKNDSNGALRIAAWKDGGVNDICPAGFSVPNKGELEAETLINTATAFSSFLKLPAAGSRNQSNGNLHDRSVAFLWARAGLLAILAITASSVLWSLSTSLQQKRTSRRRQQHLPKRR